jgi:hypothetical protein
MPQIFFGPPFNLSCTPLFQLVNGAVTTAVNGMAVVAGVPVPVIAARSIEQQEAMMK